MTPPSKPSYLAVTLAIGALVVALAYGVSLRHDRESTPEPSPTASATRVTYPACSDRPAPCITQDEDGWFLVTTGQSDMGPIMTPVTLVERRPPDAAGIEWITVLVPGYACSGDDVCRGA